MWDSIARCLSPYVTILSVKSHVFVYQSAGFVGLMKMDILLLAPGYRDNLLQHNTHKNGQIGTTWAKWTVWTKKG